MNTHTHTRGRRADTERRKRKLCVNMMMNVESSVFEWRGECSNNNVIIINNNLGEDYMLLNATPCLEGLRIGMNYI